MKKTINSKRHLLSILIAAFILRIFQLDDLMLLGPDPAWYFFQARDLIEGGGFPLIGIPSSVPILKQGALWTWVLAPVLKIFNYNPVAAGIYSAILGTVCVYLIYKLTDFWFSQKTGVIAAAISATLPFLVITDRMAYLLTPALLSILMTTIVLNVAIVKKRKYLFIAGLMTSVSIQFLLGSLILLPIFAISIFVSKTKLKIIDALGYFSGMFFGIMPFLLHDIRNKAFIQTVGLFIWFLQNRLNFCLCRKAEHLNRY
jgi:4-amino-4-deoxy-L-arabinose transferase-like glycosyltransferase